MLIDLEILQTKYQLTVDGIVHVGVNNGLEVEVYKKLFPEATVHMFEPQKKLYERLKTKFLKDNNINLYNFALGNIEKKLN